MFGVLKVSSDFGKCIQQTIWTFVFAWWFSTFNSIFFYSLCNKTSINVNQNWQKNLKKKLNWISVQILNASSFDGHYSECVSLCHHFGHWMIWFNCESIALRSVSSQLRKSFALIFQVCNDFDVYQSIWKDFLKFFFLFCFFLSPSNVHDKWFAFFSRWQQQQQQCQRLMISAKIT